ncbi:hypothetical protein AU468_13125 [Alkalispirochaeta sphaeroplastigenens]|uniref:Uncharacterized protein n=1 Tax=Alkalispirochaeta sphaeroplastigenens TaxID=1187066 RepID=A0A2S4JGI0_9SPIO|nr:hypothetical protein [Alkalispirochaeta sphaeroplastigenens]POQ98520.1 hypothetical protein AU468_13125 [Alkalispirochaeta sphaeroplastigenens]
MIMDVILQDGPRTIKIPDNTREISLRSNQGEAAQSSLWLSAVTLQIRAPESWWNQARAYFPEVLWLRTRPDTAEDDQRRLTQEDFEAPLPEGVIANLNACIEQKDRSSLRAQLPASFIRTGVVQTNLAVLCDLFRERGHYNDGHWAGFCRILRDEPCLSRAFDQEKGEKP